MNPPPQPAAAGGTRTALPWWALPGPAVAALVGLYLLTAVVGVGSTPFIQLSLHLSTASYLLSTIGVYVLALLLALPAGILAGRRFPTSIAAPGIAFMIIGTALDAIAPSGAVLLLGRGLTGLGAGAAAGVAAALALRTTARPLAYTAGGLGLLALLTGPFVGGAISAALSWRWNLLSAEPPLVLALLATIVTGVVLYAKRQATPAPHPYSPGPVPGMYR